MDRPRTIFVLGSIPLPALLQRLDGFDVGDAEAAQGKYRRSNGNFRWCRTMPPFAIGAPHHRRLNVSSGTNGLKRRIQSGRELYELRPSHGAMPLRSEHVNHLSKPGSTCVASSHETTHRIRRISSSVLTVVIKTSPGVGL